MNAKYTVAAMLLASASTMAAPEFGVIESFMEPTALAAAASAGAQEGVSEEGSVNSVGEKLERALEEQLLEDIPEEMPVIELVNDEDDIAEVWPVPTIEKVQSTS